MPPAIGYAAIMLAAGIGIPILAALNANLGGRIGSPAAAATILFIVALLGAATVMVLTGGTRSLTALPGQPKHLFLAGLLVAFYVLSITWVAPHFGLGNAVFFVLLGQIAAAALIDHFALFGARASPITWQRAAGIALMGVGVLLARRP